MRYTLPSLLLLSLLPSWATAQSLVSTQPQDRTALLEDFTGIHCGYCPDGHAIAAAIEAQNPDEVVIIGVHAGGYAVPGAGEPDFQTVDGAAIDAFFTIGGYPAGVINRHTFAGENDISRSQWASAVEEMLALASPVNLGVESNFDPVSRDLTVTVELFYTADSPDPGSDWISVALKENHLFGWQTDYGPSGNHTNYDHTHVLRDHITPTWGEEVTTTSAGTSVTRTYVYNVPAAWDISNCEVVAFVSEYQEEVYQVREVVADGGTTLVIGDLGLTSPYDHAAGSNGNTTTFGNGFTNMLGTSEDFTITLAATDAPAGWTGQFTVDGSTYTGTTTINVANAVNEAIDVKVLPNSTAGIGSYLLTVASVNNPMAPVLTKDFHVISGVTDLVITNVGAEAHEPLYTNGLVAAAQANRGACSVARYRSFRDANAVGNVFNIYYNVSWTFPAYTDETVAALIDHFNNGGNLMIAGQDIGWDQSGATGANGTPVTQAFYTDFLYADYIADGSTANSQVDFIDADTWFGGAPSSSINTVFGTNSYPEELAPLGPAVAILHYNTPTKIGAIRAQNGMNKIVYFGVGPEQMSTVAAGEAMIELSHDWFYNAVGVDEFDALLGDALAGAHPIPASDVLRVPLNGLDGPVDLRLIDASGRTVLAASSNGDRLLAIDVRELAAGSYVLHLRNADRSAARAVVIAR